MSWNHRVVRHVCQGWAREDEADRLEIQEVFYGLESGAEQAEAEAKGDYGHGAPCLMGSAADLKETVARLQRCLEYPVIDCKCDAGK